MNVVPKINTNNEYFLFSNDKEIPFFINESGEVEIHHYVTNEERRFINDHFKDPKGQDIKTAVLTLRNAGFYYSKIAELMKLSDSKVWRIVNN